MSLANHIRWFCIIEDFIMRGCYFYSSWAFLLCFVIVFTDVWALPTASRSPEQPLQTQTLTWQDFASTKKRTSHHRYLQSNYASQVAKITASNGATADEFGDENAVAISNDTIVVGAAYHAYGKGAAYLFRYNSTTQTCTEIAILEAGDGQEWDYFGAAVDIHEDTIVVGAVGYRNFTGATYVFSYNKKSGEVTEIIKITASNGSPYESFGDSVSIDKKTILVGAYDAASSGLAYIYSDEQDNGTWSEESILSPSDAVDGGTFGWYVDVYDKIAVVGAQGDDSTFVFEKLGDDVWSQVTKLTSSTTNNAFGYPVSIARDWIVVGAGLDSNENGAEAGAVYVYGNRSGVWAEVAKLISNSGTADRFAHSFAISDDASVIVVGATGDMEKGIDSGAAFVFRHFPGTGKGWTQVGKFVANDGANGDFLGVSIAISSSMAIVGAKLDDSVAVDSGSAYLFDVDTIPGESSTSNPTFYGTILVVIVIILAICGLFLLLRSRRRRLQNSKKNTTGSTAQQYSMEAADHEVVNSEDNALTSHATVQIYSSEAFADADGTTQVAVPIYPAIAIPDSGIMAWDSMIASSDAGHTTGQNPFDATGSFIPVHTSDGTESVACSSHDIVARKFQISNNIAPSSVGKTPRSPVFKDQVRSVSSDGFQGTTFSRIGTEPADPVLGAQQIKFAHEENTKKNGSVNNNIAPSSVGKTPRSPDFKDQVRSVSPDGFQGTTFSRIGTEPADYVLGAQQIKFAHEENTKENGSVKMHVRHHST